MDLVRRSDSQVRADFVEGALSDYENTRREHLAPVGALLALASEAEPGERDALLKELDEGLPDYLTSNASEDVMADTFATSFVNGLAGGDEAGAVAGGIES